MKTNDIVGWMVVNQKGQDCSMLMDTRWKARWLARTLRGFGTRGNFRVCKVQVVH